MNLFGYRLMFAVAVTDLYSALPDVYLYVQHRDTLALIWYVAHVLGCRRDYSANVNLITPRLLDIILGKSLVAGFFQGDLFPYRTYMKHVCNLKNV